MIAVYIVQGLITVVFLLAIIWAIIALIKSIIKMLKRKD